MFRQATSYENPSTKKTETKSDKSALQKVEIFDDGFNWTEFEEGIQTISKKETDEFDKLIDENFVDTYSESVIVGTVVSITKFNPADDIDPFVAASVAVTVKE